jgi:hypothetical protein
VITSFPQLDHPRFLTMPTKVDCLGGTASAISLTIVKPGG